MLDRHPGNGELRAHRQRWSVRCGGHHEPDHLCQVQHRLPDCLRRQRGWLRELLIPGAGRETSPLFFFTSVRTVSLLLTLMLLPSCRVYYARSGDTVLAGVSVGTRSEKEYALACKKDGTILKYGIHGNNETRSIVNEALRLAFTKILLPFASS